MYTKTKTKSFSLFWKYTLKNKMKIYFDMNEPILNSVGFWVTHIRMFISGVMQNEKFCLWVCFLFCHCKWRGYKCRYVLFKSPTQKNQWSHVWKETYTYRTPISSDTHTHTHLQSESYTIQEDMESLAFPDKINLISTEIKQKCSKL